MAKSKAMKGAAPRQRCWASLGLGLTLAAIALTAMLIDLRNNHDFGAKISPELGLVMALAAVALTALPAAAALLGKWDMLLRIGTILAVTLTVLAAISAYSEKQGAQILARKADNATYEAAQRDAQAARAEIVQARAEAARIAETATVAELDVLVPKRRPRPTANRIGKVADQNVKPRRPITQRLSGVSAKLNLRRLR